ncbi:MAG: phosphatase PAP2 family protein [Stagnimonas sp.]|nr:phosphatase PAP2 family protein [Stagnimonas sp.]
MEARKSVTAEVPAEQRPWKEALLWLLLLAPGFLLAYTAINRYTAGLPAAQVGEVGMDWERAIPFWPWTILPYLSINLLYAGSPFVCETRRELRTHVLRFVLMTAISAICFLLWPLRFSATRPEVDDLPGLLFALLGLVDNVHNQAPSLHISLLVVLWDCYRRHCPSRWQWLLHLGFVAIAASVLTTWQHHAFDLVSGLALGAAVCRAIPLPPPRARRAAGPEQ